MRDAPPGGIISSPDALVAQPDRASDYESEGRRFESCRARHIFSTFAGLRKRLTRPTAFTPCISQSPAPLAVHPFPLATAPVRLVRRSLLPHAPAPARLADTPSLPATGCARLVAQAPSDSSRAPAPPAALRISFTFHLSGFEHLQQTLRNHSFLRERYHNPASFLVLSLSQDSQRVSPRVLRLVVQEPRCLLDGE